MSISELAVYRFQSLYDVTVKLGKLTVVVGHSNSGKSAFGRALRAVSRNSVTPGYITKGATSAKLRLAYSDGSAVELERGKSVSSYKLVTMHGHEELYAKCGTSVPIDVQQVLRTPEGTPDLFFGTQFDKPWLLGETGTLTAKVLGDLTNVSMLAEAAREANRRRQEVLKLASIRRSDAEAAVKRVREEYSDLGARKAAVEEARELLSQVIDEGMRAEQLQDLADRVQASEEVKARAAARFDDLSSLLASVTGDMGDLEEVAAQIANVEQLCEQVRQAEDTIKANQSTVSALNEQIEAAENELHEQLKEAGVCPLCQQKITS